jgi:diamine N-acetyltransferase
MTQQIATTIRPATSADAALLAELGARTFYDTFAPHCSAEDMAAYLDEAFSPEIQAAELADEDRCFFIAEVEGRAAGYAQLHAGEVPECVAGEAAIELARMYVAKEWFGQGAAHALMQTCLDEARGRGYRTMWLGVWERNWRAQAFYRKWEFQVVGSHVFPVGSDPQVDLLMERTLA